MPASRDYLLQASKASSRSIDCKFEPKKQSRQALGNKQLLLPGCCCQFLCVSCLVVFSPAADHFLCLLPFVVLVTAVVAAAVLAAVGFHLISSLVVVAMLALDHTMQQE